ncbi:hypothetical protein ACFQ0B_45785 [Nonomuraea thailandensis]
MFLIADGALPAAVVECAEVRVTRVEPEVFVPPLPGAPAYRAQAGDRDQALYFDVMDRRVPMGLGRDGRPMYVNFDFLDGTRGAHVSISGVSGVATKTSFATFLLYSIFNSGVLGAEAANTKALIFSVKGEDLLFLDHANTRFDAAARDRYDLLGLPAAPSAASTCSPRRGPATPTACPTSRPGPGRSAPTTGRWRSSAPRSCCGSSSPTPTTSGPSTRWWSARWRPACSPGPSRPA